MTHYRGFAHTAGPLGADYCLSGHPGQLRCACTPTKGPKDEEATNRSKLVQVSRSAFDRVLLAAVAIPNALYCDHRKRREDNDERFDRGNPSRNASPDI